MIPELAAYVYTDVACGRIADMAPPPQARKYRGADLARRRADRRERLMDAVVTLIGESGWEAATVRALATEAGVAPRFVYEGFADVEELAAATYDELGQRLVDAATLELTAFPSDLGSASRAAIAAILDRLSEDPRRARFLLTDAPVLAARRTALLRLAAREYAAHATTAGADVDTAQLEAIGLIVAAGGLELIRAWLDGSLTVDTGGLAELLSASLTTLSQALPQLMHPAPS